MSTYGMGAGYGAALQPVSATESAIFAKPKRTFLGAHRPLCSRDEMPLGTPNLIECPAGAELLNSRFFSLLPLLLYTSSVSVVSFNLSAILPLGFQLSTAR